MREDYYFKRKPLVKFDAAYRAELISGDSSQPAVEENPDEEHKEGSVKTKHLRSSGRPKKKTSKGKGKKKQSTKALVNKGHLLLSVPGYSDKQKVKLSELVFYIPVKTLKQAAKRVLVASGLKGSFKKRKRQKKLFPTSLFDDG